MLWAAIGELLALAFASVLFGQLMLRSPSSSHAPQAVVASASPISAATDSEIIEEVPDGHYGTVAGHPPMPGE